jgi:ABC-type transport system involved in cytochrome c biogenesis permease subunit
MKLKLKDFNILSLIGVILLVMFGIGMAFADVRNPTYYDLVSSGVISIALCALSLALILKTFKEQFGFAKFLYIISSILATALIIITLIDIVLRSF